jgi:SAM-dependent methyltransferase
MEHISCNLCGFDETDLIVMQNEYRMVECRQCGLIYVNPRPSAEALIQLYNGYHQRENKDESTWARLMMPNFREIASRLNDIFPGKGKLMDIGCGYGHFIELMQERGWTVSGVEPSVNTSGYARSKGLDVRRATIEDVSFPEDFFEVVTAFYVLEHLFDPLAALIKIRETLKPGGIIVLRIPHTTPIVKLLGHVGIRNNLYDMPFHLYDFSPLTIRRILEKAGFENIKVTPGRPTVPPHRAERFVSQFFGTVAGLLFKFSGGRSLMPGVSKTIIACKPASSHEAGNA